MVPSIPRWASVVGAFALVATVLGLVALLDIRHQRAVAQEYLDTGVETVADQVEVRVRYSKGGSYIDEVEVTFRVAGKVPEWAPSNVNIPFASVVTDR